MPSKNFYGYWCQTLFKKTYIYFYLEHYILPCSQINSILNLNHSLPCSSWACLCSLYFSIHNWPKEYWADQEAIILESKCQRQTKTAPDEQYLNILNFWLWVCHRSGGSNEICVIWLRLWQGHVLLSVSVSWLPCLGSETGPENVVLELFFQGRVHNKSVPQTFQI